MPMIDMPLEQLREYQGVNPRPGDFDAYWDAGLCEMEQVDPQVELVESDFQTSFARCYDMYFTGVRGARIHVKYIQPSDAANVPHPAVLQFHGYSGNAGDWMDKLSYAAMGFSVFAMDCRGQGGLSGDVGGVRGNTMRGHIIRGLDDKPENLLFRHIFLDTAQLARLAMAMPDVDPGRVGACGGSQGGGLTLACAALTPGIRKAVPVYPFLCDYRRVWDMDLTVGAYEELRTYFKLFDPRHEREEETFQRLGYIDVQHLVPRMRAETIMVTGLLDSICPPSTQFAAYNKISAPKRIVLYPDFGHEGLPGVADMTYRFMAEL